MDPRLDAFQRADALFDAALDLPPHERAAFVERTCGDDVVLRQTVERLLLAHDRAGNFLREPAAQIAAPLFDAPGDDVAVRPPERIGPYRIVRELGRGGMGTVYLAERDDDQQFRQRVALKLVRGALAGGWMVERFIAERRILASLEHPHIARLFDGGTAPDGTPWFAMEYVEGEPLDRYSREHDLSLEQRLRLFGDVCTAVSYAHERGVVHRDLKPSNILVTRTGEAKLLDFGIAKLLDAGGDGDDGGAPRTRTGMHLMTPEYAAPEQVRGAPVTAASDVYSLGMVLYELLVGGRPYRTAGLSPGAIERVVCETEPVRPSSAMRRRRLPRHAAEDLDTIVLKALQKDPARRYSSAADLLEDLARHSAGRTILARPDTLAYRTQKFVGRHRVETAVVTLLVAAVPLAIAFSNSRASRSRAEPSLLATGALHERDRVLVADFTDRAGDSTLAAAITEAIRIDLTASPVVRVLTPRQVRVTLERMERSPDLALDDTLAREVAAREGVKAIVTGSLTRTGTAFGLSAQLIDAVGGSALASVRETAADSSKLIEAVDRLSRRLRERVGESLRDLRASPPLWDAATKSLPALRVFTEGQRLTRAGDRRGAIRKFEQAIALDSAFGSAHISLAMTYDALAEPGRASAALRRALANQNRLPFLDRYFIIASNAWHAGYRDSAAATYERVLARYPYEVRALNNLALIRQDQRRYAEAESLFVRAATMDSTIANLYFGIHGTQLLQGRFADSRRTLDLIARRFPGNQVLGGVKYQDASAQHDWESAERFALEKIAAVRGDTLELIDPYEALAGIAMTQGRLAEADRYWRTHLTLSAAAKSHGRFLFGVAQRAQLALRYRSDTARAIAFVHSALQQLPLDSILPGDRPYDMLARLYANAGKLARARELLAGADSNDRALDRNLRADRSWTRGVIAVAQRRIAQARVYLDSAVATHFCTICALPALARAHENAGDSRAAIVAYERYLETPWFHRYETDAIELGWAMKRLGELRSARGDSVGAMEMRERLERLWRRADPELRAVAARMPNVLDGAMAPIPPQKGKPR